MVGVYSANLRKGGSGFELTVRCEQQKSPAEAGLSECGCQNLAEASTIYF
jgi:hypothetical protein